MKIGITPDESAHLVSKLSSLTDQMRAQVRTVGTHVSSLAHATYVSETTKALQGKFEGETEPQFTRSFNDAEEKQAGTTRAVNHQMETQGSGASSITAI